MLGHIQERVEAKCQAQLFSFLPLEFQTMLADFFKLGFRDFESMMRLKLQSGGREGSVNTSSTHGGEPSLQQMTKILDSTLNEIRVRKERRKKTKQWCLVPIAC